MVNIGAFSGKTVIKPMRELMWNEGFIWINYFSATMTLIGLIVVFLLFRSKQHRGEGKTIKEIFNGMIRIFMNPRLIILILIVSGFWIGHTRCMLLCLNMSSVSPERVLCHHGMQM